MGGVPREPRCTRRTAHDDNLVRALVAKRRTSRFSLAARWAAALRFGRQGYKRIQLQLLGNAHRRAHWETSQHTTTVDQLGRVLYAEHDRDRKLQEGYLLKILQ